MTYSIFPKFNKYQRINQTSFFYFFYRLAVFDCLLIIDCFIENSILPHFTSISPVEPYWFTIAYPYFWFPFKGIIRTAAIYMMVAISAERFRAVCYPISKRHVR